VNWAVRSAPAYLHAARRDSVISTTTSSRVTGISLPDNLHTSMARDVSE